MSFLFYTSFSYFVYSYLLYNCKFCIFALYICTFLISIVDAVLLAVLLCIDGFTKIPSAKNVHNTSSNTVISFLNEYCHLHGFARKIRVDHASCFLSKDFKNFCKKYNIEIIYCTVGNHRLNGLVERLVYTIKPKFLELSLDLPKPF